MVTKCNQLKLEAADGKSYLTDVATAETLLRLVQSQLFRFSVFDDKGLETQNLRDHISEAELIFT